MYFYFSCDYPAVIKFQGVYFGKIGDKLTPFDLSAPYPLTEICPLNGGGDIFTFFLNEDFLSAPPENVCVTDLHGGYFLHFKNKPQKGEFRIIEQQKFTDALVTVFSENGFKLSLETASGFYAETLPFMPSSAEITRKYGANFDLIFVLFNCGKEKILNVYNARKPSLLTSSAVESFVAENTGFTVTEKLKDMAKHTVKTLYAFDGTDIKIAERKVSSSDAFAKEALPEELIPYAFCEEFLCGGEFGYYLSDGIKENADKLRGFLGEFIGVTPPPPFRNYDEVALIYKDAERRYRAEYLTFDVKNKKIVNINRV